MSKWYYGDVGAIGESAREEKRLLFRAFLRHATKEQQAILEGVGPVSEVAGKELDEAIELGDDERSDAALEATVAARILQKYYMRKVLEEKGVDWRNP